MLIERLATIQRLLAAVGEQARRPLSHAGPKVVRRQLELGAGLIVAQHELSGSILGKYFEQLGVNFDIATPHLTTYEVGKR